jgi:hypothetical protein
MAMRPPPNRSLKGEPETRLRAPVELVLLNPETLDGLDVAGTEAYTYCCVEVCAEAGNLALRKTLSAKSRGIVTERWRIREDKDTPKNGKGSFLAAIGIPRPSVTRLFLVSEKETFATPE